MTIQRRNAELVQNLRTDFQSRYEPNFAAHGISSMTMNMPHMRAMWEFASYTEANVIPDSSGQGRSLTAVNAPTRTSTWLIPWVQLNGTTQYLTRADEAGLDFSNQLTIGMWVAPLRYNHANDQVIWSKDGAVGQYSYSLVLTTGNVYRFQISNDGTAVTSCTSAIVNTTGRWIFFCCRLFGGVLMDMYVDDETASNNVGIPATIFNSNSAFDIGAQPSGGVRTKYINARYSIGWLSSQAVAGVIITNYYQQTRAMFQNFDD